ncbi:MAG: hypothetical protein Q7K39_02715 [Candidatus Magasanikbacteria bacterium]|nr:hypothetical protein [Candidatus Magasanikbacteria bacterium]
MIVEVALLRRLPFSIARLDYLAPNSLQTKLCVGQMVAVPFREKTEPAIILALAKKSVLDESKKIKSIESVLTETALINCAQIFWFKQIAERYRAPLGWLIKSALPNLTKSFLKKLAATNARARSQQLPLAIPASAKTRLNFASFKDEGVVLTDIFNHLESRGQTLILLPETQDLLAIKKLLPKKIKHRTRFVSGETSTRDYKDIWFDLFLGKNLVIGGTRRALSLPFQDLTQIHMVDEGNPSYKSFDMAPRYTTREAARLLATAHQAKIIYYAHSPSAELYYEIQSSAPPALDQLPVILPEIVNMRDEKKGGNRTIFSERLISQFSNNKTKFNLLIVARRGEAHLIFCQDCALPYDCLKCGANLAMQSASKELFCPKCNQIPAQGNSCRRCGGLTVVYSGLGVDFVAREIRRRFPERPVFVVDKFKKLPDNLEAGLPGSIVVGTSFVLNKIAGEKIGALAFFDADLALIGGGWQAAMELWHTLREAGLRLALSPLLQTRYADHNFFKFFGNPKKFYEAELAEREQFRWPPFAILLKFFADFKNPLSAAAAAEQLEAKLRELTMDASRITIDNTTANQRAIFIIKIQPPSDWQMATILIKTLPEPWKVDINPNNLFF